MHKLGVVSVWIGILASASGLVFGFASLFDGEESGAGPWLSAVPVGFAFLLAGVGLTQLSGKR